MNAKNYEMFIYIFIVYCIASFWIANPYDSFMMPLDLIYNFDYTFELLGGYKVLTYEYLSSFFIGYDMHRDFSISTLFMFVFKVFLIIVFSYILFVSLGNFKALNMAFLFYFLLGAPIMLGYALVLNATDYMIYEIPVGGVYGFYGFVLGASLIPNRPNDVVFSLLHFLVALVVTVLYMGVAIFFEPINVISIVASVFTGLTFGFIKLILGISFMPKLREIEFT
jgi:hypothetical protein